MQEDIGNISKQSPLTQQFVSPVQNSAHEYVGRQQSFEVLTLSLVFVTNRLIVFRVSNSFGTPPP